MTTPILPATLPPTVMEQSAKTFMMIDPKTRAGDFQQVFEALRKDRANNRISFQLTDGTSIANILDMQVMPGGTLIVFKVNTTQGMKYQVVPLEHILSIEPN